MSIYNIVDWLLLFANAICDAENIKIIGWEDRSEKLKRRISRIYNSSSTNFVKTLRYTNSAKKKIQGKQRKDQKRETIFFLLAKKN